MKTSKGSAVVTASSIHKRSKRENFGSVNFPRGRSEIPVHSEITRTSLTYGGAQATRARRQTDFIHARCVGHMARHHFVLLACLASVCGCGAAVSAPAFHEWNIPPRVVSLRSADGSRTGHGEEATASVGSVGREMHLLPALLSHDEIVATMQLAVPALHSLPLSSTL